MAIDKISGFDLLHKECYKPDHPVLKLSPKAWCVHLINCWKEMLAELKWKCAEHLQCMAEADLFELVKPVNYIAVIMDTIEHLASKERLMDWRRILRLSIKRSLNLFHTLMSFPLWTWLGLSLRMRTKGFCSINITLLGNSVQILRS